MTVDPRRPSPSNQPSQEWPPAHLVLGSEPDRDQGDEYVDDHGDATDRLLELISAVEFLRRGDRRGLTLWSAIEEALRWWTAERAALLDGHAQPSLRTARFGGSEALPTTLVRFVAAAGQNEPIHLHLALQQAVRRWTATMADRYIDGHTWPPPQTRGVDGALHSSPPT